MRENLEESDILEDTASVTWGYLREMNDWK